MPKDLQVLPRPLHTHQEQAQGPSAAVQVLVHPPQIALELEQGSSQEASHTSTSS